MQNTPKAKDENLNNKSSGIQNLPHFQMINKSKSTNERANISLNLNIQKRDQNNESTMQKNKKEIIFPTPKLSPQKKAVIPRLYEVCDADTFESIATKFSIPESWLIRQNIKLINDPHFILSKGIKLNVTEPSHSMIKPLDCSLVNGESHNDAQESTEDDELGQNGKIYVVINENSFDFIPDTVSKEHKPLHIKLSSLNDDAVIYTPKLQREKMKKKMQNEQLVTANNSAQERAENKETTDLEEHDKKMENVEQSIPTTEEAKSSPTLQEDFIEVEKSDENGSKQEIQEKCEEIVKVDAQESVCEQSNKAETEKVVMEASQIEKEKVDGSETVHVDQIATETKELTNNSAPEQSSEKDSVLVVSYLLNPRDESSLNALYFRVRKEEGNKFSDSLQKAIKEAKQRAKARLEKHKHDQIPKPNIPPSPSSPLSFFQSIFSTIKDSFSHLNDEIIGPTINNNNNDNNNNNSQTRDVNVKRLYRRSLSEKLVANPFAQIKNSSKDDMVKPRRNSEIGEKVVNKQKRKVVASSVLLKVKIVDGPSAIFERTEEIDQIRSKLPYRLRSFDWMLVFRLSRDGSSFTNFFNCTKNTGPIVFIMSTSTKERIGAFIPTGFKYSTKYYGSGEAFVFRFVKAVQNKNKSEKSSSSQKEETQNSMKSDDKNSENQAFEDINKNDENHSENAANKNSENNNNDENHTENVTDKNNENNNNDENHTENVTDKNNENNNNDENHTENVTDKNNENNNNDENHVENAADKSNENNNNDENHENVSDKNSEINNNDENHENVSDKSNENNNNDENHVENAADKSNENNNNDENHVENVSDKNNESNNNDENHVENAADKSNENNINDGDQNKEIDSIDASNGNSNNNDDNNEIDKQNANINNNQFGEDNSANKIENANVDDGNKDKESAMAENKSDESKNSDSDINSTPSFAHLEIFRWTSGTSTSFMMSETNTIIIGIGKDKESYNKNEIETINSSHGQMSGPAIWIGEDLQYASSSPCDTFGSPQLTKKNFFYVVDIEIWKFGFFSGK